MEKFCPKCGSDQVKGIERAHFISEWERVNYEKREPTRYECKRGWTWRVKK